MQAHAHSGRRHYANPRNSRGFHHFPQKNPRKTESPFGYLPDSGVSTSIPLHLVVFPLTRPIGGGTFVFTVTSEPQGVPREPSVQTLVQRLSFGLTPWVLCFDSLAGCAPRLRLVPPGICLTLHPLAGPCCCSSCGLCLAARADVPAPESPFHGPVTSARITCISSNF